ncbi:MAG: stage II sporulation protein P [Oscillospiraceae bacterium]|nr:stage II sporulation protein P [Oscillospiraceae bacterium]
MKQYERARRVGLAAIALALVLRLYLMDVPKKIGALLAQPKIAAFLQYLETGRNVRFSPSLGEFSPDFVESAPAATTEPTFPPVPAFSGEEGVEITYSADKNPDIPALLQKPLEWHLYGQTPTVLVLHTHSTESYTKQGEDYRETSSWRTLDENYNMLSIGAALVERLREAGICAIQDRELHDYPSYNGSYSHARKAIREILEQYPGIQLILDLHRDASGGNGKQMRTRAKVEGENGAQLMVVLGTNHKDYEENLSLGLKLHTLLEERFPGIMRPLQLRAQRFNQDLCPGALLIEVGAAGNTHGEAMTAADALAEAVIALAQGSEAETDGTYENALS